MPVETTPSTEAPSSSTIEPSWLEAEILAESQKKFVNTGRKPVEYFAIPSDEYESTTPPEIHQRSTQDDALLILVIVIPFMVGRYG